MLVIYGIQNIADTSELSDVANNMQRANMYFGFLMLEMLVKWQWLRERPYTRTRELEWDTSQNTIKKS